MGGTHRLRMVNVAGGQGSGGFGFHADPVLGTPISSSKRIVNELHGYEDELQEVAVAGAPFEQEQWDDGDGELGGEGAGTFISVEFCGPHIAVSPAMLRSSNDGELGGEGEPQEDERSERRELLQVRA